MRHLVPFAVACCILGCGRPHGALDTAWKRVPNAYATHFAILARGPERLLIVLGHGGVGDTVGRYWLAAADTSAPGEATHFKGPLQRIALTSTTHAPYISALGRAGTVAGMAHLDQLRDSALVRATRQGHVVELATGDGLDREQLVALRAEAVFTYPFGGSGAAGLGDRGAPLVEVSEYLEEHPLGRAEWLRFFGALLGREREADSLFAAIRARYEREVAAVDTTHRPSVFFGSTWQGQWFVPPGNSCMARSIQDAGGHYLFADRRGDGNITLDMETVVHLAAEADAWGKIAEVQGPLTVQEFVGGDPRALGFKAVREGHLFIGNTATADLFGEALLEPDRVLHDLARIFHPVEGDTTQGRYFQRVRIQ